MRRQAWNESRWGIAVKCSDYDSLTSISRIAGSPDLEYMLRLNQIMINFVKDKQRDEYVFCVLLTQRAFCYMFCNVSFTCSLYVNGFMCFPRSILTSRYDVITLTYFVTSYVVCIYPGRHICWFMNSSNVIM